MGYRVAVVGATGNVGREMLNILEEVNFPVDELHAIASRTTRRPAAQDDIERVDAPFAIGGVVLRRPSTAALEWLRTNAARWWGDNIRSYQLAVAYACASRDREWLDRVSNRVKASFRISLWANNSGASEEALRRAAVALLPPHDDSEKWFEHPDGSAGGTLPDLLGVALVLQKEFGQSVGYWLYDVSDDDFWGAFCLLQDEAEAVSKDALGNPNSWIYRHRVALAKCEKALERDVIAWMQKRIEAQNG